MREYDGLSPILPPVLFRAVPLDLTVSVSDDGTLLFDGKIHRPDGNVTGVRFRPDLRMEPARSQPVTRDQLELQLKKSGGTPFSIRNLRLSYSGTLFAPLAALNKARRDFLVTAEETLIAASLPRKRRNRSGAGAVDGTGTASPLPGNRGGYPSA